MRFRLRKYSADDHEAIPALFYETVHAVCRRDYTEEQLNAWALAEIDATLV